MSLPPIAGSTDLDLLRAAVAAEDSTVDLSGAVLRSGWENVVVETNAWIFRFPRTDALAFERELAILERIQGRLPAATPRIEWTGRRTRFAAYRKLTGTAFDLSAYLRASAAERDSLAHSLAEFLVAMHECLSLGEISELGIPAIIDDGVVAKISAGLALVPAEARSRVEAVLSELFARQSSVDTPEPQTVLHNDFHLGNLVLNGAAVAGVWDFSCVGLGAPSFDLRYFEGDCFDLLSRLATSYARLSGREIDLDTAITANRAETILDALDTGQPSTLTAAAKQWHRFDADRAAMRRGQESWR